MKFCLNILVMAFVIGLLASPSALLAQNPNEPIIENCVCPPARCDSDCEEQKGIFFFTPICKASGKKLSCAQAKCVPRLPKPDICAQREQAIIDAANKAKKAKEQKIAKADHGVFVVALGDVDYIRKDGSREKARIGSKIYAGDTVETGKDGKARIMFTDNNVTSIIADTRLEILEYINDEKEGSKNVVFGLTRGQVRHSVNQKYDGVKQRFQVKTPSAVAGVRGTEFIVGYSPENGEARVVTFKGEVEFGKTTSQNGNIIDGVSVMPGQGSIINRDMVRAQAPLTLSEVELSRIDEESNVGPLAALEPQKQEPRRKQDDFRGGNNSRKPASTGIEPVCRAPAAVLFDCHWSMEKGKCVRNRCFADGQWRLETHERDQSLCAGGGMVGSCQ